MKIKTLEELEAQRAQNLEKAVEQKEESVSGSEIEYPDVPEITEMGDDLPNFLTTFFPNNKAALTSDDIGKAEVFENAFKDDDRWGGSYQDKFGKPLIVWNDNPYYINKPGLSATDLNSVLGEMVKYFPASKFASGAKSLIGTIGATESSSKAGERLVTPKTVTARDNSLGSVAGDIGLMTGIGVGADVVLPPVVKGGVKLIKAGTKGTTGSVKKVKDLMTHN